MFLKLILLGGNLKAFAALLSIIRKASGLRKCRIFVAPTWNSPLLIWLGHFFAHQQAPYRRLLCSVSLCRYRGWLCLNWSNAIVALVSFPAFDQAGMQSLLHLYPNGLSYYLPSFFPCRMRSGLRLCIEDTAYWTGNSEKTGFCKRHLLRDCSAARCCWIFLFSPCASDNPIFKVLFEELLLFEFGFFYLGGAFVGDFPKWHLQDPFWSPSTGQRVFMSERGKNWG